MTKPDKPEPMKPEHPEHPVHPEHPAQAEPVPSSPAVIDFELTMVATEPAPTKRTTPKKGGGPLLHIACLECGDTADSRDRKLVMRAADIHARTAHGVARSRVRPPQDSDA